jgi:hypothetical protein
MYLLFPGRHHLVTQFQFDYLQQLIRDGCEMDGERILPEAVVFAVTSANHSNTRRNPLPFYLRAMMLARFSASLGIPCYVYGIDDLGHTPDFADYTIKRIVNESEGLLDLHPGNTQVICSTPVLQMYRDLGYRILPAELSDESTWSYHTAMPWQLVELIADNKNNEDDLQLMSQIHPAAQQLWQQYQLSQKIRMLFSDKMIGSDGDLTSTRDYNVYVRQMDEIAGLKFNDTAPFIQSGRIGDIGCAVGSWIRMACAQPALRESDFYGIEVSRFLFELCQQRKLNGDFVNPFVFFSQKNAVTGLVFPRLSMNTIHTSSLTHEIESYGGRADLLQFIRNRFEELVHGGCWINRDVVAPFDKEKEVYLWLREDDGENSETHLSGYALPERLRRLSTRARFYRFAHDFRKTEGYALPYRDEIIEGKLYHVLQLADAAEFLSRKDYADNWESEMHETFCFWDFDEWKQELQKAGFRIHPGSYAFRNEWIAENRWKNCSAISAFVNGQLMPVDYPLTTMILVAVKD